MKTKYLLALDQSTKVTGIALFKNDKLIEIEFLSPNDTDYTKRIYKLITYLKDKLLKYKKQEIIVAFEDIQLQTMEPNGTKKFNKNFGVDTFKKLAHVQGAIISLLEELDIPYLIVSASSWKKTCGINEKYKDAQKAKAQEFVKNNFNLDVIQDEADAICLGYHATQILNKE